ncbi:hypothetical protein, partial [Oleiphilus sp. HI0067]
SQFGGGTSGSGLQEEQTKQQVSVLTRSGQSQDPSEQALPRGDVPEEESSARYQAGKLVPFGYELFAGAPSTFEPVNDIPVS